MEGGDKERHERGEKLTDDKENRTSESKGSARGEMSACVTGFSYQNKKKNKNPPSYVFSPEQLIPYESLPKIL